MELDDATLIAECRKGRQDSFEKLMGKYSNLVGSIAYNILGDVHVACCTRCPYPLRYVPTSGADVEEHDGLVDCGAPQMISAGPDCRHPLLDPRA